MKKYYNKYLILVFICLSLSLQAQPSTLREMAKENFDVSQSSEEPFREADLAVDDNNNSFSSTKPELNPWFKIKLNERYRVDGIKINHHGLQDLYILSSKVPFISNDIDDLITDPWVDYIHIPGIVPNDLIISIPDFVSEYIMIVLNEEDVLSIKEVTIYGDGMGGGHDDPDDGVPCEGCPDEEVHGDPSGGALEICGNMIDDDLDDRTDCDDPDCGVGELTINIINPTCVGCSNGSICIEYRNADEISIDGGQFWIAVESEMSSEYCFEGLSAGEYSVVARRLESGCETDPADAILFDGSIAFDCDNEDFETGTFDGWTGSSGTNNGSLTETNGVILDPTFQTIVAMGSFNESNAPVLNTLPPGVGNIARVGKKLGSSSSFNAYGRLSKCIAITPGNSLLSFNYSVVLHAPTHSHSENELPYFKWRIIDASNNNVVMESDKLTTSSPLLSEGVGNWRFLPWNCQSIDLSGYVGENMCIEFFGVGCSKGGHAGYAYVDLTCGSNGITPVIENTTVESDNCEGNLVNVKVEAFFYSSYEWRLFTNENPEDWISLGVADDSKPLALNNVLNLYRIIGNKGLDCNDKMILQLHLNNDCNNSLIHEIEIDIPCISWKAAYPTAFSPYDDNEANPEFFITFNTTNFEVGSEPDCSLMHNDISTINYVRLQIFDRWDNKIFDEDKEDFNFNIRGDEPELRWDGTYNDQLVLPDSYNWLLYVGSCGSNFNCQDCDEESEEDYVWNYCSSGILEKQKKKKKEDETEAEEIWVEVHKGTIATIP